MKHTEPKENDYEHKPISNTVKDLFAPRSCTISTAKTLQTLLANEVRSEKRSIFKYRSKAQEPIMIHIQDLNLKLECIFPKMTNTHELRSDMGTPNHDTKIGNILATSLSN